MRPYLLACALTAAALCAPAVELGAQGATPTPRGLLLEATSALRRADLAPDADHRRDALGEAFAIVTELMIRFPKSDPVSDLTGDGVRIEGRLPITATGLTERVVSAGLLPEAPFYTFAYVANPLRPGVPYQSTVIRLLVARQDFERLAHHEQWADMEWDEDSLLKAMTETLTYAGHYERALDVADDLDNAEDRGLWRAYVLTEAERYREAYRAISETPEIIDRLSLDYRIASGLATSGDDGLALEVVEKIASPAARAGALAEIAAPREGSRIARRAESIAHKAENAEMRARAWGRIAAARPGADAALTEALEAVREIQDKSVKRDVLSDVALSHLENGDMSAARLLEAMVQEIPDEAASAIAGVLSGAYSAYADNPAPTASLFEETVATLATLPTDEAYSMLCATLIYMANTGYVDKARDLMRAEVQPRADPKIGRVRVAVLMALGDVAKTTAALAAMQPPVRAASIARFAGQMADWSNADALSLILTLEDPRRRANAFLNLANARLGIPY